MTKTALFEKGPKNSGTGRPPPPHSGNARKKTFFFNGSLPLPGAGCLAAEEVDKDGEDPVRGVVEGDVSSNLILVLPPSVVTAMLAWPPHSSIL